MPKEEKDVRKMKEHDSINLTIGPIKTDIVKVPGGWIYVLDIPGYRQAPTVFVPEPKINKITK